ncbi:MAG: helix-turn-helix domain-containing protein [Oceanospirillales bacterium]|nr:helix-turn-helix domain-containing protein [Oceanospirillales bacterium]
MQEKKHIQHESKWGKTALSMGWTGIPTSLFFLQGTLGLSPVAFNVLLNILLHWWKPHDWPHPSQESIAVRMSVSVRTVQRGIAELEQKGLLTKIKTSKDNPKYKGRNIYDLSLLVSALDTLTPKIKEKIES